MNNTNEPEGDDEQTQIPPKRRSGAKERDQFRCRTCGAMGIEAGGTAHLEVHHIESNPSHCQKHDLANLLTLCTDCHGWVHLMPEDVDEVPFELSSADRRELRPHDICILRVLVEGPARPSKIADEIPPEISSVSVRERLWLLAGLDNVVEERQERLVVQSSRTGKWGLADDISSHERGRIPTDTKKMIQRIRDERVRRALDRGIDRDTVASVFELHRRTTYCAERRARAFEFPLDALADGDETSEIITMTSRDDTQLEELDVVNSEGESLEPSRSEVDTADETLNGSDGVTKDLVQELESVLITLQKQT